MKSAPPPANEAERLEALHRYDVLDTPPEAVFDQITREASALCETPGSLISFVDQARQWFKSRVGVTATETPRDIAFCAHAILQNDIFVVPDALADDRFADNPLVTGEPHVRFYAGVPLRTPEGLNVGTLCVIDQAVRELDGKQSAGLRALAREVVAELELRRSRRELEQLDHAHAAELAVSKRAQTELDRFFNLSVDMLGIAGFDGVFRRVNPAFASVIGYTRQQVMNRRMMEFVHPDDLPAAEAVAARLRAGQSVKNCEIRYVCSDGSVKWISWSASPVVDEELIYAAGRDVTAARKAEEALRESELRTRSVIDNSLGGVITTDSRGVIESVNPAAEAMFGYLSRELVGSNVAILSGDSAGPGEVLHSLRTNALGHVTEVIGRRRNGQAFPCELSLFEFSLGAETHYAGHLLDISERQELERLKSDFVATVSHELRTPLTSIRGALTMVAAGVMGPLPAGARDMILIAERNSVRLISLINDILDLEKLQQGRMEMRYIAVSVRGFFQRAIESVAALAAAERVTIDTAGEDATVFVDEERLAQVLLNLLSNAVRHSSAGTTVTVSSAVIGSEVEIRVTDHGTGISSEAQPRLFQRFQQIDNSDSRPKGGTGLGLAICKAIVEQHAGTIGVQSRLGEGSTFWLRLPLAVPVVGWSAHAPLIAVIDGAGEVDAAVRNELGAPAILMRATAVDDALRMLRFLPLSVVVIDALTAEERLAELLERIRSAPHEPAVTIVGDAVVLTPQQLAARLIVVDRSSASALSAAVRRLAPPRAEVLLVSRNAAAMLPPPLDRSVTLHQARGYVEASGILDAVRPALIVIDAELPSGECAALVADLQHNVHLWNAPLLLHGDGAGVHSFVVGAARFHLRTKAITNALHEALAEHLRSAARKERQ